MAIRSRNKVQLSFSMASMTDIVFLLLIFFIIISTLVSPYALNVNLPTSNNKSTEKAKASVTITPDLVFAVNGRPVAEEELERELQKILAGQEKPFVTLNVDQSVPTGVSVKVLDIANRNKFGIVLATQPN